MDADANHGYHERRRTLCVYEHATQAVIIEDAVADTFRGSALFIDLFINICAMWDIGVKQDIPFGPILDATFIFEIRSAVFTFGTVFLPIGTAPHEAIAGSFMIIGIHAQFHMERFLS